MEGRHTVVYGFVLWVGVEERYCEAPCLWLSECLKVKIILNYI
jgi:hypothetical protein